MLTAPKSKVNKVLIGEGTHIARVVGLIHLGTAEDVYMGEKKMFNKIRLTWEFTEETHKFKEDEEAKPIVHSQEYTLSMGKKSNLRPIVEGMIGTTLSDEEAYNFNFESLVGIAGLVSIKHRETKTGAKYAKVASTSKLMKGQVAKPQVNQSKVLVFDKWDEQYFLSLPDFIKDKIKKSNEYKAMKGIKVEETVKEDDGIPW